MSCNTKPSFRETTRKVCFASMKCKMEDIKLNSDDLSTLENALAPYKVFQCDALQKQLNIVSAVVKYFVVTVSAVRKEKIAFVLKLVEACYAIPITYEVP
nr:AlNc14C155G7613 [Albugo laibachii Nc14]|eukprot:CCA22439.1 AlNc14C155G7613 [Albugo laibachii Nc14]